MDFFSQFQKENEELSQNERLIKMEKMVALLCKRVTNLESTNIKLKERIFELETKNEEREIAEIEEKKKQYHEKQKESFKDFLKQTLRIKKNDDQKMKKIKLIQTEALQTLKKWNDCSHNQQDIRLYSHLFEKLLGKLDAIDIGLIDQDHPTRKQRKLTLDVIQYFLKHVDQGKTCFLSSYKLGKKQKEIVQPSKNVIDEVLEFSGIKKKEKPTNIQVPNPKYQYYQPQYHSKRNPEIYQDTEDCTVQ